MIRATNRRRARERGFTLIEMIVSLLLLGLISAMAGIGLVQITEGYVFTRRNAETIQKVQIAMTRIVKELGAATAVTAPAATSVGYARLPGPAAHTLARAGDRIELDGATLIDQVTALDLAYFDAAGTATGVAASVRRIDVRFTVTGANDRPVTVANTVHLLESYW